MWRKKKLIVIAVLAAVLLAGSMGGVALAQTDNGDDDQPKTLMERVAEILGVDQQELEDAFDQAKSEMRDEALDSYLEGLIAEGEINEEEAEQYKTWWQGKPDMGPFREQMREWAGSRPDVPLTGRFGDGGFMGGMKRGGGRCFGGR